MAKRGERLGSQEDGRVHSEHLTVTLKRGQKARLKEEAKKRGVSVSKGVQDAISSWTFTARRDGSLVRGKARKRPS